MRSKLVNATLSVSLVAATALLVACRSDDRSRGVGYGGRHAHPGSSYSSGRDYDLGNHHDMEGGRYSDRYPGESSRDDISGGYRRPPISGPLRPTDPPRPRYPDDDYRSPFEPRRPGLPRRPGRDPFKKEVAVNHAHHESSILESHIEFANEFGLSPSSSLKLKSALEKTAEGDPRALRNLGISENDETSIIHGKALSREGLLRLARELDQDPAMTQRMVSFLGEETQRQALDVESPLWQSCINSGQWRTPENSFCKEAHWPGCSPQTKASFCLPD